MNLLLVDLLRTFSARDSNHLRTWAVGPGYYIARPWRFHAASGGRMNSRTSRLELLAAGGYRSGKLTHAEVQMMLGLTSRWETDAFLKQAGDDLDYPESGLEYELETSDQFARQ